MSHPLAVIPPAQRPYWFTFFLILTLVVMVALNVLGAPLQTAVAPLGIVSFELAGDVATAQQIVDSWDDQARVYAGFNLGLDYLFMVAYATVIALAILWLADSLQLQGRARAAAVGLAWGQWLAAGLDAVENAALLILLVGQVANPWPAIAFWTAVVKFGLIGLGLLYVLLGSGLRIIGQRYLPFREA
jgi:hypothetical protein